MSGARALLPMLRRPEDVDALAVLEMRSRRLANVVEAVSRRRDVRQTRAKLMLLLLELRCPPDGRPAKDWYVPGAVARIGAEGLRRAWKAYFGEEPRSLRTFRTHLAQLELAGAIVKSPGDWLPVHTTSPEKRPRHAETIHVLETDRVAAWWADEGAKRLEKYPGSRHSPDRWRERFGEWRQEAHVKRQDLFAAAQIGQSEPQAAPEPEAPPMEAPEAVKHLTQLLRDRAGPLELFLGLQGIGARVKGRATWSMAVDRFRLEGAVAMLVVAMARGDRIRTRSGWLVRAFRAGQKREMAEALGVVRGRTGGGPRPPRLLT